MYLVIDTRKQDGTILGHVHSIERTMHSAARSRKALMDATDAKHGAPTIWASTGALQVGEPVGFFQPRIAPLKPAELKMMGDA